MLFSAFLLHKFKIILIKIVSFIEAEIRAEDRLGDL
jgi:hypothetical protein